MAGTAPKGGTQPKTKAPKPDGPARTAKIAKGDSKPAEPWSNARKGK